MSEEIGSQPEVLNHIIFELLKDVSYIGSELNRKSDKYHKTLEAIPDCAESLSIKLVDTVNKVEKNLDLVFKKFCDDIEKYNSKNDNRLSDLANKLKSRRANFKEIEDSASDRNQNIHVETRVNQDSVLDISSAIASCEDKEDVKTDLPIKVHDSSQSSGFSAVSYEEPTNVKKDEPLSDDCKEEIKIVPEKNIDVQTPDKPPNLSTNSENTDDDVFDRETLPLLSDEETRQDIINNENEVIIAEPQPTGEQAIELSSGYCTNPSNGSVSSRSKKGTTKNIDEIVALFLSPPSCLQNKGSNKDKETREDIINNENEVVNAEPQPNGEQVNELSSGHSTNPNPSNGSVNSKSKKGTTKNIDEIAALFLSPPSYWQNKAEKKIDDDKNKEKEVNSNENIEDPPNPSEEVPVVNQDPPIIDNNAKNHNQTPNNDKDAEKQPEISNIHSEKQPEIPNKDAGIEILNKDAEKEILNKDAKIPNKDAKKEIPNKNAKIPNKDAEKEIPNKHAEKDIPYKDAKKKIPNKDAEKEFPNKYAEKEIQNKDEEKDDCSKAGLKDGIGNPDNNITCESVITNIDWPDNSYCSLTDDIYNETVVAPSDPDVEKPNLDADDDLSNSSFVFDMSSYYKTVVSTRCLENNLYPSRPVPFEDNVVENLVNITIDDSKDDLGEFECDIVEENLGEYEEIPKSDTVENEEAQVKIETTDSVAEELLTLLKEVKVDADLIEISELSPRKKKNKQETKLADELYKDLMESDCSNMSDESITSTIIVSLNGDLDNVLADLIEDGDIYSDNGTTEEYVIPSEEQQLNEDDNKIAISDETTNSSTGNYQILEYLQLIKTEDLRVEKEDNTRRTSRRINNQIANMVARFNKKYQIKELSVVIRVCPELLERLKDYESGSSMTTDSDNVDRLCNLNSLLKRKSTSKDSPRSKKKRLKKTKSTSHLEYSSDSTASDISTPCSNGRYTPPTNDDLDENILADAVLSNLIDSDDSFSDDPADDSVDSKSKNKREGEAKKSAKKKLTYEEEKKKSWRKDPLLKGKLTSSDSESDSGPEKVKKTKSKKKYEYDTDFCATISSSESSRSLPEVLKSPQKETQIKIDFDSDSLSANEFEYMISPNKTISIKDEDSPKKGRKNIRALMSDDDLTEATQRAKCEEKERRARLRENSEKLSRFSQSSSESQDTCIVLDVDENIGPLIKVHPVISKRLKPHQVDGVKFMWDSCYESVERLKHHDGSGCILAHCMGLGKTYQVIALIHTLFSYPITNTNHVLIVCPLSTVINWKKEFNIAFKNIGRVPFEIRAIADKKDNTRRCDIVRRWRRQKGVLIVGYDCFEKMTSDKTLAKLPGYESHMVTESLINPGPDLIVCDEGHLLRSNSALRTIALMKVNSKRRIVLTGTPLQNNLVEYYYMVQFVKPNLLGTLKEYRTNFISPISNGQYDDSTAYDIRLMKKRTHVLNELLKDTVQRVETKVLQTYLPKIRDYALFLKLHATQADLYYSYLETVKNRDKDKAKKNNSNFFSDYKILSYVSSHPYILKIVDMKKDTPSKKVRETDTAVLDNEPDNVDIKNREWLKKCPDEVANAIDFGHKLLLVKAIIEEAESLGEKVLVFSQNLSEMDCLEHFLKTQGTSQCPSWTPKKDYYRMDGTVAPEFRNSMCEDFNNEDNSTLRLFIMSLKVGGLGLNLTAANRVILLGVSFNPSNDIQSVYRAYRFGQKKECFVYRLIALGTMEEKIYQRSVTKLAIAHRVVDKHQITRHYKFLDLQEMYQCDLRIDSDRTMPNVPDDKLLAKLVLKYGFIFLYHDHQMLLENRPEEELNELEKNMAWEEFNKISEPQPIPVAPPLPLQNGVPIGGTTLLPNNTALPSINTADGIVNASNSFTTANAAKTNSNMPSNTSSVNYLPMSSLLGKTNDIPGTSSTAQRQEAVKTQPPPNRTLINGSSLFVPASTSKAASNAQKFKNPASRNPLIAPKTAQRNNLIKPSFLNTSKFNIISNASQVNNVGQTEENQRNQAEAANPKLSFTRKLMKIADRNQKKNPANVYKHVKVISTTINNNNAHEEDDDVQFVDTANPSKRKRREPNNYRMLSNITIDVDDDDEEDVIIQEPENATPQDEDDVVIEDNDNKNTLQALTKLKQSGVSLVKVPRIMNGIETINLS